MKKLLTAAAAIILALGAGTVVHALPYSPDVEVPDVKGVPEVGSVPETPRPPSGQDGIIQRKPSTATQLPGMAQPSKDGIIPSLSFGAGLACTFEGESTASAPESSMNAFVSLYVEWYPLIIQDVFGVGCTLNYDVVPVTDGDMVVGTQLDARWIFSRTSIGNTWVACRVGPAYESGSNSLRLYGYLDLGFDLHLGKTVLETRVGGYLTGTGGGFVLSAGMDL